MLTHHDHHHCITDAIAQAKSLCETEGLRFTGLRQRVLELIWNQHRPIKAYDLLDQLKTEDASAKPPTVYRTLDFLLEHGLVHRINRMNAFIGCNHPNQHDTCYFMICSECGEVEECCTPELKTAILSAASSKGFIANNISVEIEGICARCQQGKTS
jgi:Fur family zinc uptake transcriptional regulator